MTPTPRPPLSDSPAKKSMVAAWYGLIVLLLATVFASIDRNILLLVTEPLKHSLGLSDTQIGVLNGIALSLFATVASFPMGWLADRIDRRLLLAVCVLIWSVATAAIGFAHSFMELFLCGTGIAVGEAVLGPITYSLIPDLFPRERWILANYIFFLAGILGAALGLSLSGAMIGVIESIRHSLPAAFSHLDTWRLAMLAVAAPGPVIAALILLIRLARRTQSADATPAPPLLAYFRTHARTLAGIFLGFGFAAAASGTVGMWTPVALVRVFHESATDTGVRLGLISAIGSVAGVLLSGVLVRATRPGLGDAAALRVAQMGVLASMLLTPFILLVNNAMQIYGLTLLVSTAMHCSLALSPTLLQFTAPRELRGRVVALGGMAYIVFLSISPMFVGMVSDQLPHSPRSLLFAMVLVGVPFFAAGLLTLRFGEKTLAQTLAAAAEGEAES